MRARLRPFSNRNFCSKMYFYNEVKAQDDSGKGAQNDSLEHIRKKQCQAT